MIYTSRWYSIFLIHLLLLKGIAQDFVVCDVRVHDGNGNFIENGCMEVRSGKIANIYNLAIQQIDTLQKGVVHLPGMHIYPALILMNSNVGLNEIEALRATQDRFEVGDLNSHIRSVIAYNSDSDILPTLLENGILMAQLVPRGTLVCGSSSVMVLNQKPWVHATYISDEGMHLNWPDFYPTSSDDAAFQSNRNKKLIALDQFFEDAKSCQVNGSGCTNLRLRALAGVLDGKQRLYIRANHTKEILEIIPFIKKHNIKKVALVGAENCKSVWSIIAEHNIPVVLDRIHSLPLLSDDHIHSVYRLPYEMTQAGIKVALSYEGDMEAMGSRNLPFLAGTAAAYGLGKENALQLVTKNCADILGISQSTGSLDVGKEANFIISAGDLLDMKTSTVTEVYFKGEKVTVTNKQRELYKKYKKGP